MLLHQKEIAMIHINSAVVVLLVLFFLSISSYRNRQNKKRVAKISRDLSEVLRLYGIPNIDILSTKRMEKYVTVSKLLTSLENKVERLKRKSSEGECRCSVSPK